MTATAHGAISDLGTLTCTERESLIEHRASVEGPHTTTPRNLIRLSIGLENAADLIEDLDAALR